MVYLRLFFEFFRAGLFAVGGGLATLPFLYEISDKTGWFTHQQLADMVAISESTPGPIGVNMAPYVGFTTGGLLGSVVATLGLIAPAAIISFIVAGFLHKFKQNRYVQAVFYGLRPASVGLILAAGWLVVQMSLLNLPELLGGNFLGGIHLPEVLLAAAVYFVLKKWKPHPVVVLAGSAVAGILFRFGGA